MINILSSTRYCRRTTTTFEISEPAKQPSNRPLAHDLVRHLQVMIATSPKAREHLVQAAQGLAVALDGFLARPEVNAGFQTAVSAVQDLHRRVVAIDAPGYTPYFKSLGLSDVEARLHAGVVRSLAVCRFRKHQDKRIALKAFHDLAKRPRWHPALFRQVERLRDHGSDASFLDKACSQVGVPALKDEMVDLLRGTREGSFACGSRLISIVAQLAPYAPSARGRPVRFDSVLHQVFLDFSAHVGGQQGYTYDACRGDFTDKATAATRKELRRSTFNPVAARYAERKQQAGAAKTTASKV